MTRILDRHHGQLGARGMEPTPEVLGRIRAYVEGEISLDEYIAEAKARYGPSKDPEAVRQ